MKKNILVILNVVVGISSIILNFILGKMEDEEKILEHDSIVKDAVKEVINQIGK